MTEELLTFPDSSATRGVTFLGPAAEPLRGGEVRAFARDPDGHRLEITSPT